MNDKIEPDLENSPSGLLSKLKKYLRNPFFIKTTTVAEVVASVRIQDKKRQ